LKVILFPVTQTPPSAKTPETKTVGAKLPVKVHKRLKVMAATRDTTMQELFVEAVQMLLEAQ